MPSSEDPARRSEDPARDSADHVHDAYGCVHDAHDHLRDACDHVRDAYDCVRDGYDYVRDGAAIYATSFATIRAEADLSRVPAELTEVAVRMVHACGMVDLVGELAWSDGFAARARSALRAGAPVLCDTAMVAAGVIRSRLPADNEVVCTLSDERVPGLAAELGTTRSAAALELWRDRLAGAVVAIGNAPTALFHLLEMIAGGAGRPAAVIGIPVGFVGAVESKRALSENGLGLEYLVVHGRRGGSAITAAAVNALSA